MLIREHTLRYVLRNRKTDQVLFVVNFALIPLTKEVEESVEGEDADEDKKNGAGDDEID